MGVCFFEWFSLASLLKLPQGWVLILSRRALSRSVVFVLVLGSSGRTPGQSWAVQSPLAGDGAATCILLWDARGPCQCPAAPAHRMGLETLATGSSERCRRRREDTQLEDHALLRQFQLLFALTSPQAKAVTALTLLASMEMLKPVSG